MSSILTSDPVVIGGSSTAAVADDIHSDIGKPPTITNTVATLLINEDRDGNLAYNRNSDSTHSWKLTGQGAGFAGGFATRVLFGSEYKNGNGESVAPVVTIQGENLGVGAYISNVTSSGYDLNFPALGAGAVGRIRLAVKQPS